MPKAHDDDQSLVAAAAEAAAQAKKANWGEAAGSSNEFLHGLGERVGAAV